MFSSLFGRGKEARRAGPGMEMVWVRFFGLSRSPCERPTGIPCPTQHGLEGGNIQFQLLGGGKREREDKRLGSSNGVIRNY